MKSNNSVFQRAPYGRWKIFKKIRFYLYVIPKNIWDRATKGYCSRDLWNLNSFYCTLFYESITEFKNGAIGFPVTMETFEEWKKELEHISELFKRIEDLENDDSYYDEKTREINTGLLFQMNEEISSAKNEAFDLMKKHFFDLWD